MATKGDFQVAALAAGFSLGFGFLTVWEAIKQTRRNQNPKRSPFIYMIWGEIVANLGLGLIGWFYLDGSLGPTVPMFFFMTVFWAFEVQLLMQIIINRIALIADNRKTIQKIKWGTIAAMTTINVAVFVIWIPSHIEPPASELFVKINNIWDRMTKALILLIDASLNYYFLRTVKKRLVKEHGLVKYQPLVSSNAKLMIVSVAMDALLIGLMFMKNGVVYIQFHPITYMIKLNIEMSMASLIVKLAQGRTELDATYDFEHDSTKGHGCHPSYVRGSNKVGERLEPYEPSLQASKGSHSMMSEGVFRGIQCHTDVEVQSEWHRKESSDRSLGSAYGDELPLHKKPGCVYKSPL